MSAKYTPDTVQVRNCYRQRWYEQTERQSDAEFDRWLAGVRAEAKSEALEAYASGLEIRLAGATRRYGQPVIEGHDIIRELRDRAAQIKEQP